MLSGADRARWKAPSGSFLPTAFWAVGRKEKRLPEETRYCFVQL